jgi:hypothetical protein
MELVVGGAQTRRRPDQVAGPSAWEQERLVHRHLFTSILRIRWQLCLLATTAT